MTLRMPAVALDKAALPPSLRREIVPLVGAQPAAFVRHLVRAWLFIVAVIVVARALDTWWATALAVPLVATRQAVLFLLVHEQVHRLGLPHRRGNLAVNLACAFPLLFGTVEGYAQVHLDHHRHYFTDADPDHRRKSGAEWGYPKPWRALLALVLRDLGGVNFLRLVRGKRAAAASTNSPPRWVRPAFHAGAALVITFVGGWGTIGLYWILPLFTVLQVLVRWGAVCEHEYNRPGARVADTTPLILPPWWQQLVLPNLNFNLHLYHHYFPAVACDNLPRVDALFRRHGLVDEAGVFRGYGAYLRHLQRRSHLAPRG
jgi:fatty acid desaturase